VSKPSTCAPHASFAIFGAVVVLLAVLMQVQVATDV
jgi:hypothetical protein